MESTVESVGAMCDLQAMTGGHVEKLKSGNLRVIVFAGKDPITGKKVYLKETHKTELQAAEARSRMLAQVEAESHPDRSATVAVLMQSWMNAVDHELNTRVTSEMYIRRVLVPAFGDMSLRKLQHRVDIIDRLYSHLRRCGALCDGRPFTEHTRSDVHDCAAAKCREHKCSPMAASTIRRIHAILTGALSYAVSWGWIEKNPATSAHPPKLNRRRARARRKPTRSHDS